MVFPIIRVDTTVPPPDYCPPVENLQVLTAGDSCIDVTWDAFINHQFGYEVQYGPRSMPMGNWQSVFPNLNFAHICDLDPTFLYGLRVRPYCDEDKSEGEWSEVVYFRPTVGAALEPSELSKLTSVAPNPATESVMVESDYVIMAVDVYDAVGQHVWNIPVHGRRTEIDLNGLSAGFYHLMITTSDGTTSKRLVVTR
ncbi:MAG: T9SS type A sorting domain-containing protein [Bacteroidales bacterium]|nr:T9SS type A sorting domain-containing protein [Bacteroidales bacterium]